MSTLAAIALVLGIMWIIFGLQDALIDRRQGAPVEPREVDPDD